MIFFFTDNHYNAHPGKNIFESLPEDLKKETAFFEDDFSVLEEGSWEKECSLLILHLIGGTCGLPHPGSEAEKAVRKYCESGRPLLLLHGSSAAFWQWQWWRTITGLRWVRPRDPDNVERSVHPTGACSLKLCKCRHELAGQLVPFDLEEDEVYAYSGLRFGQVFEAAIPIAIIAVGASTLAKRKSPLSENVIIQSIGASSGVIVAGAIFTLPAIYIIKESNPAIGAEIQVNFMQIFLASLLGGFLGILFLIPFRKYFVSEMHGKYPFPEATATTEILVSGAKGGAQAKLLVISSLIGGLYDFLMTTFRFWSENISTRMFAWGEQLATNHKFVFKMNASSILLGTGYLIGLKYATIICAGSFLSWWFIVPLLGSYGLTPDGVAMSTLSAETIFADYVRYIGIGGIAMAGILGVIKSAGVIKKSMGVAFSSRKSTQTQTQELRTERDLSMKIILFGFLAVAVLTVIFFLFGGLKMNLVQILVSLLVIFLFAFLFTTVAATAIATVGNNPVSGMTMMTLILASFILSAIGLQGGSGIVIALVVGGIVCSALAMAGGFITDLKIGYWIGTSPYKQQMFKFLGTAVSALTVGAVIMLLSETYGYSGDDALVAPQANAMAAIIQPLMFGGQTPWLLYIVGAILALLLDRIGIPALAFSLGMFIPLQLNVPLLIGGALAWYVGSRSKDEVINKQRKEKGTLLASGLLAGGAIMGVVSAILKNLGIDVATTEAYANSAAFNYLAIAAFATLCIYLVMHSISDKKQVQN